MMVHRILEGRWSSLERQRETNAAIAVLGATGNQGGHVARALRRAGLACRAVTRQPETRAALDLKATGCELGAADMEDPDSLLRVLTGVRAVFSVQNVWDMGVEKEVRLGAAVIEAARRAAVSHFVYASGLGANSPRGVAAIDGKAELERRVAASGLPFTILRPALFVDDFFGASIPFRGAVKRLAARHRPAVGRMLLGLLDGFVPPGGTIPVTSLDDLGKTVLWCVSHPPAGGGQILSLVNAWLAPAEIRRLYTEATGVRVPHIPLARPALSAVHPDMAALLRFLVSLEPAQVVHPFALPALAEQFQRIAPGPPTGELSGRRRGGR